MSQSGTSKTTPPPPSTLKPWVVIFLIFIIGGATGITAKWFICPPQFIAEKHFWFWFDILKLGIGSLGIIVAVKDCRALLSSNLARTYGYRSSGPSALLKFAVSSYREICRGRIQRNQGVQKDHEAFLKWTEKFYSDGTFHSPKNSEQTTEALNAAPKSIEEKEVVDLTNEVKSILESLQNSLEGIEGYQRSAQPNSIEEFLIVLSPYLLSAALSMELFKTILGY